MTFAEHADEHQDSPAGGFLGNALIAGVALSRRVCRPAGGCERTRSGRVLCCADGLETAARDALANVPPETEPGHGKRTRCPDNITKK